MNKKVMFMNEEGLFLVRNDEHGDSWTECKFRATNFWGKHLRQAVEDFPLTRGSFVVLDITDVEVTKAKLTGAYFEE